MDATTTQPPVVSGAQSNQKLGAEQLRAAERAKKDQRKQEALRNNQSVRARAMEEKTGG